MKKTKKPKSMTWDKHYKGGPTSSLDIEILKFLWKWKLAPIRVLHQALAPQVNPNTFNKRIKKLEKNKLIHCQMDPGHSFLAWELSEFGFYIIRESLGAIKDHGFRSASFKHDRLVLAFHLGEWIWHQGKKPLLLTDQELLKYPKDILSNLVPQSEVHRPDGYTLIINGEGRLVFAIEVELHAKSVSRYQSLIVWYRTQSEITQVLWLIADPLIMEQILSAKQLAQESSLNYHVFVELEDYLQNGWGAFVRNENQLVLKNLRDFMRGTMGLEPGDYVGTDRTEKNMETFTDRKKFLKV